MNGKDGESKGVAKLRWRAVEIVQTQGASSPKDLRLMSRAEALRLVHELRAHQIEPKMQNEELCRAQAELTATRERYLGSVQEPSATSEHGGAPISRVVVSDMSEQKQMEAKAKLDAQLRQARPRPRVSPESGRRKNGKAPERAARR